MSTRLALCAFVREQAGAVETAAVRTLMAAARVGVGSGQGTVATMTRVFRSWAAKLVERVQRRDGEGARNGGRKQAQVAGDNGTRGGAGGPYMFFAA